MAKPSSDRESSIVGLTHLKLAHAFVPLLHTAWTKCIWISAWLHPTSKMFMASLIIHWLIEQASSVSNNSKTSNLPWADAIRCSLANASAETTQSWRHRKKKCQMSSSRYSVDKCASCSEHRKFCCATRSLDDLSVVSGQPIGQLVKLTAVPPRCRLAALPRYTTSINSRAMRGFNRTALQSGPYWPFDQRLRNLRKRKRPEAD